jgi:hypothetical protein
MNHQPISAPQTFMKSSTEDSRKINLTQAKDGLIKGVTVDPLDKRRRLVEVRQLDALLQRSLSK